MVGQRLGRKRLGTRERILSAALRCWRGRARTGFERLATVVTNPGFHFVMQESDEATCIAGSIEAETG